MKYRDFIRILLDHGFEKDRQRGSHRIYKGRVDGRVQVVTVACHQESDDILPKNLQSMIRQSGLGKGPFRG